MDPSDDMVDEHQPPLFAKVGSSWVGLKELLKFFRSPQRFSVGRDPWTMDSKADGDRFTRFTRPTYINLLERCVELSTLLCGGARFVHTFSQPIDFSRGCDPVHATRTGAVIARGWVLLRLNLRIRSYKPIRRFGPSLP